MSEHCTTCNKQIDPSLNPSTTCSACGKLFCDALYHTCFMDHVEATGCKGHHQTCLNPSWEIRLKPTIQKDEA